MGKETEEKKRHVKYSEKQQTSTDGWFMEVFIFQDCLLFMVLC
jgi:heme/copper-type cytochrome/quinol oxidase subunit 3